MGKELALTPEQYLSGPVKDQGIAEVLKRCLAFAQRSGGGLQLYDMPSDEERAALQARRAALAGSMTHDKRQIALYVTEMLQGYRNAVKAGENPREVVALYVRELGAKPLIPTWAVWRACGSVRLGNAPGVDVNFPPSTMALRALCDKYVWETRAEMSIIGDVLCGRPATRELTAAERAETGRKLEALSRKMGERIAAEARTREPAAPISQAQLVEMAGGQDNWDRLPDAVRMATAVQIGQEADRLARAAVRRGDAV